MIKSIRILLAIAAYYVYEIWQMDVILYVDDILIIGNDVGMLSSVKAWLSKNFSMKDLGEATYVLGIRRRCSER